MMLTRKERESLVIDLLNKCTPIREIATQAGLSFRDIGAIKKKAEEEKEAREGQAQQIFISTQAYKLFSEGKSPVQVAIALNIREPEVVKFYVEYWNLVQHHNLSRIYQEIKDDIGYFVRLYRLARVARMGVEQVVKLLEIANNDLPLVEHKCERLKREVDAIEAEKRNSARIFQELTDKISTMLTRLDSIRLDCEKEMSRLQHLQQERMKQEALVKQFENNNEEYVKLTKTVEEKVHSILVDRKELLGRAVLCVIESIRMDPDKYGPLIYCNDDSDNTPPSASPIAAYYNRQYYYPSYTCSGQQQCYLTKDSFKQAYIDMLRKQSEKLFTSLEKMLIDEVIDQYVSKTTLASSLSVLPFDDKQQQKSSAS